MSKQPTAAPAAKTSRQPLPQSKFAVNSFKPGNSWHARPETEAKLKQRVQALEARLKADRAAARKRARAVMDDPKGYRTTSTQAAESTAQIIIEHAERRAQKILDDAHRLGKEIIRQARRGNPGRPPAAHPDPDEEQPIRFREDWDDGA